MKIEQSCPACRANHLYLHYIDPYSHIKRCEYCGFEADGIEFETFSERIQDGEKEVEEDI